MVLRYDDPERMLPIAGDTFIDKDGNATVLTETNGVVGYGQGMDLYGGMKYGDRTMRDGDLGGTWHGDTYMVDEETGEGHFRTDWLTISKYESTLAEKIENPKDGLRVGYWLVYKERLKAWTWMGPKILFNN